MEDLLNGIARLFGILYRTIFQLIPSGLLIISAFLVIYWLHPKEVKFFIDQLITLKTYQLVFLFFITLYTLNTIIDGITEFIVNRVFEFGQEAKVRYASAKNYGESIDRMLWKYTEKTNLFSSAELAEKDKAAVDEQGNIIEPIIRPNKINFDSAVYDFAIVDSLKFHKDIYNYIQYREGLLDLFSNTFVVLIILFTSLVPYTVFKVFDGFLPLLIFVQTIIVYCIIVLCFFTLKKVNRDDNPTTKKKRGTFQKLFKHYGLIGVLAFTGLFGISLFIQFPNFDKYWLTEYGVLLFSDALFIPILYVLLMTSFRNYMFVDRACVSYQLLRNYGHEFFKEPIENKH